MKPLLIVEMREFIAGFMRCEKGITELENTIIKLQQAKRPELADYCARIRRIHREFEALKTASAPLLAGQTFQAFQAAHFQADTRKH